MEIHLEKDEIANVIVDGTCCYQIQGYRNEEGTMILGVRNKNTDVAKEKQNNGMD